MKKLKNKLTIQEIIKALLYVLPLAMIFSYHPVIKLGSSDSMNFELSVALIWLVAFDVVILVANIRKKEFWLGILKKWPWLLLPVWLSLSVLWSLNMTRGVLTVGIVWLMYLAIYGMWHEREMLKGEFARKWWWWLMVAALIACGWCLMQCILDVIGVGREYTLMCAGCTYKMFGFPHPNGFAIEPQFMGNLLLLPAIAMMVQAILNKQKIERKYSDLCLFGIVFVLVATLFLTFSRGAIYAFGVAMIFMSVMFLVRERRAVLKRIGAAWGVVILAFLFTLNLQGVLAQISPTDDTYWGGVSKVVNHLSLGVIEIRNEPSDGGQIRNADFGAEAHGDADAEKTQALESELTEVEDEKKAVVVVEKPVENSVEKGVEQAVFDGYVAESTDTRLRLTSAALEVWGKDARTVLFGVGLGGAGQALYNGGLSPAPKEIVQNEYASLLLETGVIGVILVAVTLILVVRAVWKVGEGGMMILAVMLSYGVTLCFFSGVPNVLHIYLLTGMVAILARNAQSDTKT